MNRLPRFLLGIAVLFWGYETHLLLGAIVVAVVLELPHFLNARWEFSNTDLNRIWDLCAVLMVGIGLYIATTNDAAKASFQFIQYVPFAFLPIMAAVRYGTQETLQWSVFSWFLRRTPNSYTARRRVDINWIYFGICLFAASAAHDPNPVFYPGMCAIVAFALFSIRPTRFPIAVWVVLFAIISVTGNFAHHGLFNLQAKVQTVVDEWIAEFLKHDGDQHESRTSIGKTGRIKLSGKIVMRVRPEGLPLPPSLLREATFDDYAKGIWRGVNSHFDHIYVGNDETADLLPKKNIRYSVRIARILGSSVSPLALPQGAFHLSELGPVVVSTNRLGFARSEAQANFVNYVADYGPGASFDSPPAPDTDYYVPPTEKQVIESVARSLHVDKQSPEDKMKAVVEYFRANFKYSTELLARATNNHSALASFLTDARAGHCEYFATAATLLLRELGVPARYATGFAVQEGSRSGDTYLIRERHAHAWTLAWDKDKNIWREVDATPANWEEVVDADASEWEHVSDFFSNIYFQFSKWRWSKATYTKYLPWALVPLVGVLVWRIFHQQSRKRTLAANDGEENVQHVWQGLDSEFFTLEKKLHEAALGRLPHEPLLHWRDRLRRELPATLNLDRTLNLHRRLRFDPNGLNANERRELRDEVNRLLKDLEAHRRAVAAAEDKKNR